MRRFFICSLFVFKFLFFSGVIGQKCEIGLYFPLLTDACKSETDAAWEYLSAEIGYTSEKVYPKAIKTADDLKKYSIVWLHHIDTLGNPLSAETAGILRQYLDSGGKLLLTQEAFALINLLGIEPNPIETRNKISKNEGYGRQLGLHSFRTHPVFKGLNGGAYLFCPEHDTTVRIQGFFNDRTPLNGAVVAVDWDYIFLREQSKLMLEYFTGKGKVLAIGGYIALSQPNKNRQHLEMFLRNCMDYLSGLKSEVPVNYWQYYPQAVISKEFVNDDVPDISHEYWNLSDPFINLLKEKGDNNYWEVAGERMVIMGKEKVGIDEIWTHPFMSLHHYKAGIKSQSDDTVQWLNYLTPSVEIRPEVFLREYRLKSGNSKEAVFVSQKDPVGVVHYEYTGMEPCDFFVQFMTNLRLMWPYSEEVFKTIECSYQPSLNAAVFAEGNGDFTSLIGTDMEPKFAIAGQYEDYQFEWKKGGEDESYCQITGITGEKFEAGGIFQFRLVPGEQVDIFFVAEATLDKSSEKKAIEEYKQATGNASQIFLTTHQYNKRLLENSLMIETPDTLFNRGYKWALMATDRFYVNTPGSGGSLVAGYNTTNTGWDGGHKVDGRPGYAWYFGRDGQWSGFTLLDYGDFTKVKSILEMYIKFQDLNGKIYHEISTSGVVHYDAADATPLFIILAGRYLAHSGDLSFIRSNWNAIKKSIDFCFSTDTDHDHLIENTNVGHGWVEGGSLFGTHSTLYLVSCWAEALEKAAYMSLALGSVSESEQYKGEALVVRNIINTSFWNDRQDYFYEGKFEDGTFMSSKSIMPAVPLYFSQVPINKAGLILPVLASSNFTTDWGCRIIGENDPDFNPRGYHTGSVWPLFSGWAALAEFNNGNQVQGYTHVMNSLLIYRHWGLGYIEEVLNGEIYQPSGVCRHQCWSETMVLQPSIEGLLGLKTDAINETLNLSPGFPADWDSVKATNIRIGQHFIDFKMTRKGNQITYDFSHTGPDDLEIIFNPMQLHGLQVEKIEERMSNGFNQLLTYEPPVITMKDKTSLIYHTKYGISVLPVIALPEPGDKSTGIRIISDKFENEVYQIIVEGLQGTTRRLDVHIRDWKIQNVENAKVIFQIGEELGLEVSFLPSVQKYMTQEVKIFLTD